MLCDERVKHVKDSRKVLPKFTSPANVFQGCGGSHSSSTISLKFQNVATKIHKMIIPKLFSKQFLLSLLIGTMGEKDLGTS